MVRHHDCFNKVAKLKNKVAIEPYNKANIQKLNECAKELDEMEGYPRVVKCEWNNRVYEIYLNQEDDDVKIRSKIPDTIKGQKLELFAANDKDTGYLGGYVLFKNQIDQNSYWCERYMSRSPDSLYLGQSKVAAGDVDWESLDVETEAESEEEQGQPPATKKAGLKKVGVDSLAARIRFAILLLNDRGDRLATRENVVSVAMLLGASEEQLRNQVNPNSRREKEAFYSVGTAPDDVYTVEANRISADALAEAMAIPEYTRVRTKIENLLKQLAEKVRAERGEASTSNKRRRGDSEETQLGQGEAIVTAAATAEDTVQALGGYSVDAIAEALKRTGWSP